MRYILAALIALLSACATTGKYKRALATWKGESVDKLVMSWGPPNSSFTLSDGSTVLEYSWGNTQVYYLPGNPAARTPGYVGSNYNWCKTLFTVAPDGHIRSISFQGNSCKSR